MSKRMVDLKVADGKVTAINGNEVGGGTAVEANPQEEATEQLNKIKIDNIAYNIASGGSSGGGFIVKNITTTTVKLSTQYSLNWVSGRELKSNTAYAVGDQVQLEYNKVSGFYQITKNEIAIPVIAHNQVAYVNQKLQFGDVILVCTNADYSIRTNKSPNKLYFSVDSFLTYTVVKAGSTGSDVTIPSSISGDLELVINFYDLEQATA